MRLARVPTYAFDSTLFPVLVEEYPEVPTALAGVATLVCSETQFGLISGHFVLSSTFVRVGLEAIPVEQWEVPLQVLSSIRPSLGDAPAVPEAPFDNGTDARLVALCVEHGHVLVCGRRAVAETAWKFGVAVKNLREFLKAVGDARYRFLDEQTGR